MIVAAGHQYGALLCNLGPAQGGGCQRYPIAVGTVAQQIETNRLTVHLPPEVVQRHQQGRGEQICLCLDVAFVVVARFDVAVAALEKVLLVTVKDVVTELMRNREALATLRRGGTVVEDQPLRPRLIGFQQTIETIEIFALDLVDRRV